MLVVFYRIQRIWRGYRARRLYAYMKETIPPSEPQKRKEFFFKKLQNTANKYQQLMVTPNSSMATPALMYACGGRNTAKHNCACTMLPVCRGVRCRKLRRMHWMRCLQNSIRTFPPHERCYSKWCSAHTWLLFACEGGSHLVPMADLPSLLCAVCAFASVIAGRLTYNFAQLMRWNGSGYGSQ